MAKRYSLNKTKYLLDPEFQKLHELLNDFQNKEPRNCLLLQIALKTGARARELLNLKKDDINAYEQSLLIRGIKGSNDREIPLPEELFLRLVNFCTTTESAEIFPISYTRLWQIWEHYRPAHKKFHCLRHTFAIQLFKKTKDIRLVQVALGHRNITNTMIYADYVYSQTELRRLIL